jgi:mRNA-degrading endonuclease YafQ of YafQ-DinJ toxin-antitoxin module
MSAKARDKALSREWEEIRACKFKIIEDIAIIFKGILYNI